VWKRRGAFHLRPSMSCLPSWETKTKARKKRRRLPSRSRNRNPDASARSLRRRLLPSRALHHRRHSGRTTLHTYGDTCGAKAPLRCHSSPICSRFRDGSDRSGRFGCGRIPGSGQLIPVQSVPGHKSPPIAGWLSCLMDTPAVTAARPHPAPECCAPGPFPPAPYARCLRVPAPRAYRSAPFGSSDPIRPWCAALQAVRTGW
jgi:hypothetical protein